MHYSLQFELSTYTTDDSTFPMPENDNYDFWVPLMKYYLDQSDTIEIHCWNEESEVIEETKSIFNLLEMSYEYELTYFKGKITSEIIDHILYNNLSKDGELKWFSIFLNKENNSLFHSGHWASEYFAPNVSKKDLAFIQSVMPSNTRFNHYKHRGI
jgi:hypothetical protein